MHKTLTALLLCGLLGLSLPVLAETDSTGPTLPEPTVPDPSTPPTPEEPSDISPTDPTDDGGYTPGTPADDGLDIDRDLGEPMPENDTRGIAPHGNPPGSTTPDTGTGNGGVTGSGNQ